MPKSDLASREGGRDRDRSSCMQESELVGDGMRSLRRSHMPNLDLCGVDRVRSLRSSNIP